MSQETTPLEDMELSFRWFTRPVFEIKEHTEKELKDFARQYLDKQWYHIRQLDPNHCHPIDLLCLELMASEYRIERQDVQFFGSNKGTIHPMINSDFNKLVEMITAIEQAKEQVLGMSPQ